jgi:carbon storage regulator CsrA
MHDVKGSLLLTRKEGENIIIEVEGRKIVVSLDKSMNQKAKIRIYAPEDVKISREEIYKQENYLFNIKNNKSNKAFVGKK